MTVVNYANTTITHYLHGVKNALLSINAFKSNVLYNAAFSSKPSMPDTTHSVSIGLINPKSASNVGAVMRAAGCYQADHIYYTGERFRRAAKYHTDTKNHASNIPLTAVENLSEHAHHRQIVCIELAEGALPLPDFQHPPHALYIFGPEDGSIPQSLVDQAHATVYIPTIGCMNLAATVNVVLYDRLAKCTDHIDHEARIRNSRDMNNRLVVK